MPDTWIILLVVLAGAAIGLVGGLYLLVPRRDPKLVELEKQRDRPDVAPTDALSLEAATVREAAALMKQGKKIDAVKIYRERMGVSLAEAKAAVEKL